MKSTDGMLSTLSGQLFSNKKFDWKITYTHTHTHTHTYARAAHTHPLQSNFIAKCLVGQLHSSQILVNYKTSLNYSNNNSKHRGEKPSIDKDMKNPTDIKLHISHQNYLITMYLIKITVLRKAIIKYLQQIY